MSPKALSRQLNNSETAEFVLLYGFGCFHTRTEVMIWIRCTEQQSKAGSSVSLPGNKTCNQRLQGERERLIKRLGVYYRQHMPQKIYPYVPEEIPPLSYSANIVMISFTMRSVRALMISTVHSSLSQTSSFRLRPLR